MNTTGYKWKTERGGNKGGRPSKTKEILAMGIDEFLSGSGGEGSIRGAARALCKWSGDKGLSVSYHTSRRVILKLMESGRIEVVSRGRIGMSTVIKPVVP